MKGWRNREERIKDRGMTLLLASSQISTGSQISVWATSQKILNNSMTQDCEMANNSVHVSVFKCVQLN